MVTNKASTLNVLLLAAFFSASLPGSLCSADISQADETYDADTYGPEEAIHWTTPTKAVFTHKIHTMDAGLACDSCHDSLFPMEQGATEKKGDFTMKSFKEGKYCGACHDGKSAFDSATQCGSCHFAPETPIVFTSPVKAVSFDHSIHLKKGKLDCEACHKEVFTMKKGTIEEAEQAGNGSGDKREYLEKLHNKYCGTCHDYSQAFGYLTRCTVCHIGVKGYNALPGSGKQKDKEAGNKH